VSVLAVAHRGEPVGHRENTLPAFAAALTLGADMVELDLRRTRDGVIVALHDQTLERLWGVDASVGDLDWSDVAVLGSGDRRIPTLDETLAAVPCELMIDLTRREHVRGALSAVEALGALERSLFVTGNVPALRMLRTRSPEARIGLTWTENTSPPLDLLAELGAEFWNPMRSLVTPAGVAAAQASGCRVSTWTVDEEEEMARVVGAGVDAVVSNRIGALVHFLAPPAGSAAFGD
jgi:glycerophosphoryl diester phosphodiesterase